jgi:heparanase 1
MHKAQVFKSVMRVARARRYGRGFATLALTSAIGVVAWSSPSAIVQNLGVTDPLLSAGLSVVYGSPPLAARASRAGAPAEPVTAHIDFTRATQRLDPRFLSVALDTSQLVGGHWWSASGRVEVGRGAQRGSPFDLSRPGLLPLARALAPAYLRVGGTEADHVYYAFDAAGSDPHEPRALPPGYELALHAETWDALNDFTSAAGLELFFTLNAGPGPRARGEAWRPDNAEALLRHARDAGQHVSVFELGNEVNGYWFIHGIRNQVDGARYAADMRALHALVERYFPDARVAGPGSLVWPLVGEPLSSVFGILDDYLEAADDDAVDIITWHYYPQQSRRCPVATRRATLERLLEPSYLDEVERWAHHVSSLRERHAPGAEIWLGETGNAQCGGEPGVSDRFVAGLWWLDQLGLMARAGERVVVRQTLSGSEYGLIDDGTLRPNPDYYNSLLWKQLMGDTVLRVTHDERNPRLRLYAHCTHGAADSVTLLAINTDPHGAARVRLPALAPRAREYSLTAPRLDSRDLWLNGERLELQHGAPPELRGRTLELDGGTFELAPASYSFVVLEGLDAPACGQP